MGFQFESLIGHLFVVNGRTLSTPPPGALVVVTPKDATRGREADTFYALVLPSGGVASATFYEQLAEIAAERYFTSGGSVTAGLRAVFDTINQNLLDHNRTNTRKYEANMVCAVLHENQLFVGRCGLCVAALWIKGETTLFPTDPLDETDISFGPPLGVRGIPDVKLKQYTIERTSRFVLATTDLTDTILPRIHAALSAETLHDVLVSLKDFHTTQAICLVAELLAPDEPLDLLVHEGDNSKEILSNPLPADKKLENIDPDPGLGTRIIDSAEALRDQAQEVVANTTSNVAHSAKVANGLIDHYLGEEDTAKTPWWNGALGAAVAAGIPIIVVALVIVLWVTNLGNTEYETCINQAFETASLARSISSSDVNGTLSAWNAVLLKVDECEVIRPEGIPNQPLIDLQREGQTVVDQLLTITRRQATPVVSFPSAQLTQAVLRGLTMYVLDDANDLVYEFQLSGDGRNLEPNTQAPIATMRRGAQVNQFTVDDILDITWAEDGSALSQSNVLIALDRNGVVVEHSPTILTRGAQRLLGSENWVNPVAIQVWRGNLYILDPGANQVWRYAPSGGSYSSPPTEYFAGENRPNINNAVDFAIDGSGQIYVTLANGQMGKYVSGEAVIFAFANFPSGQQLNGISGLYFSTSPIAQVMYLASQPNRTVYEVTHAGTFMRSYRIYEENLFESLSGVIADPAQGVIYALSGNTVFAIGRDS
ncbi:MAG: hypothetical protein ACOYL5_04370 [Phototrophicaceae bacterium]